MYDLKAQVYKGLCESVEKKLKELECGHPARRPLEQLLGVLLRGELT